MRSIKSGLFVLLFLALLVGGTSTALGAGYTGQRFFNDPGRLVKLPEIGFASLATVRASVLPTIPMSSVTATFYSDYFGDPALDGTFVNDSAYRVEGPVVYFHYVDALGGTLGSDEGLSNDYIVESGGARGTFQIYPDPPAGTVGIVVDSVLGFESARTAQTLQVSNVSYNRFDALEDGGTLRLTVTNLNAKRLAAVTITAPEYRDGLLYDVFAGTMLPGYYLDQNEYDDTIMLYAPRDRGVDSSTWTIGTVKAEATEYSSSSLTASARKITYGYGTRLSGRLIDSQGHGINGRQVEVIDQNLRWVKTLTTDSLGNFATYLKPASNTTYRVFYPGDLDYAWAFSNGFTVSVMAYLTTPSAPSHSHPTLTFTSVGDLKPHHTAGGYAVKIRAYLYVGGRWVLHHTVSARSSDRYSYTRYTGRVKLPHRGKWKLVAYHADAGHVGRSSGAHYVTVY